MSENEKGVTQQELLRCATAKTTYLVDRNMLLSFYVVLALESIMQQKGIWPRES
jgi:hypothetical protein